jgi:hypothetical protein
MKNWTFLVLMFLPGAVFGQGVIVPGGSYQEKVTVVENGVVNQFTPVSSVGDQLNALPPDDSGKFHAVVFWRKDNQESVLLARDLQQEPSLKAIADWANTFYVDVSITSQQVRLKEYDVPTNPFRPVLCIFPPRNSANFPYTRVFWMSGYDGEAQRLAADIMQRLNMFYDRHTPGARRPCPGPNCPDNPGPGPSPSPAPWNPSPQPSPGPGPPPLPNVPNIWPPVNPQPGPGPRPRPRPDDPDDDDPNSDYPDWPCITIIYDRSGIGEHEAEDMLVNYGRVVAKYLEVLDAKLRRIEFGEAKRIFPLVKLEDTPAAIYTEKGRVRSVVPRKMLLALISGDQNARPRPPRDDKKPTDPPTQEPGPGPVCPLPPAEPMTKADPRIDDLLKDLLAIKHQVEAIANRGPLKGDKGDPGTPGRDGAPGNDGIPGLPGKDGVGYTLTQDDQDAIAEKITPALLAFIDRRIENLDYAKLAEKLPPVWLQTVDAEGKTSFEAIAQLGKPVNVPPVWLQMIDDHGKPISDAKAPLGKPVKLQRKVQQVPLERAN